jgi:quinol monooxygenase YgiN
VVRERYYARFTRVHYRPGKRDKGDQVFKDLFVSRHEGFKGYMVHHIVDDPDKAIYISFWATKEAMDRTLGVNLEKVRDLIKELTIGTLHMEFTAMEDFCCNFENI